MKANPVFSLYIPTKLVFGCGEIKKLSSEKVPGKKALVVISSGTSMRKYGYLERVLAQLRLNNVETLVYDKILPNPIKEHVMEAAAICREERCDFVVGLGGGSSIDSAKSIAVMACNDGDYGDYETALDMINVNHDETVDKVHKDIICMAVSKKKGLPG